MEQDHVLRVYNDGGCVREPAYEINHPPTCEVIEVDGGMYRQYLCPVGRLEAEWGLGSHMPWWTFADGEYTLGYSSTGSGERLEEDLTVITSSMDLSIKLGQSDPDRPGNPAGQDRQGRFHTSWPFALGDNLEQRTWTA